MSNNIFTGASALTNDSNYNILENNIICIDLEQGFIGVHKSNPNYEIDVSGRINCDALRIGNNIFNTGDIIDFTKLQDSIIPATTNIYSLGSDNKIWRSAYINNLSGGSIDVSININPLTNNTGSLGASNKGWGNAYIQDISVSSMDVSVNLNPLINNSGSLGNSTKVWSNAYIKDLSVGCLDISSDLNPFYNNLSLGATNNFWRNAYIQDISVSSIDVSTNINPLINNTGSLGNSNKLWRNAYINDLSVANISISGNIVPLLNISGSLGAANNFWRNAYIQDMSISYIDVSTNINPLINNTGSLGSTNKLWRNAYINDLSVANISISGNIVPLLNISGSLGATTRLWRNAYIQDISVSSIDVSTNLNPLTNNGGSVGASNKIWNNAYIRDVSVSNAISICGNIIPTLNINSNLGSLANRWKFIYTDNLSINKINGATYVAAPPIVISSITSNIIPSTTNTYNLGSASMYWKKAYISDLSVSNINIIKSGNIAFTTNGSLKNVSKLTADANNIITINKILYQDISNDTSWNTVNGYYGLAKDAYPGLNPRSSIEKAVLNWIPRDTRPTWTTAQLSQIQWSTVCWSPELELFASLSSGTDSTSIARSMWSVDGMFWNFSEGVDYNTTTFTSICWSPEKKLFVAVANGGSNRLAYSYNGKKWQQWYNQGIVPLPTNDWSSVCWSSELHLFVAVATGGGTNRVAAGGARGGATGIETWSTYVPVAETNSWTSVCWSGEVGIFVAVATNGNNRVMTSSNGTNWTIRPVSQLSNWSSVCWSKEQGIFVAVATSGTFNVMTSNNGINWTAILSGIDSSWNSVCWSGQLGVFVAVAGNGINRVMSSSNGINWTARTAGQANTWMSICWSPELGIFVAVSKDGTNRVMLSSLKSRPPTSTNVFDRRFINNVTPGHNSIDEAGAWTFSNLNAITLKANGSTVSSDDRLKHNEINISNGLTIIDQLTPKFYQKTQVMLDASYNGDLSGYIWNYEAGLIAQDLLQISDISFVVGGGDIYDSSANLVKQEPYNVNYNSVFTYGLAAIKELHQIIDTQETTILKNETIINSLISRIEALENKS